MIMGIMSASGHVTDSFPYSLMRSRGEVIGHVRLSSSLLMPQEPPDLKFETLLGVISNIHIETHENCLLFASACWSPATIKAAGTGQAALRQKPDRFFDRSIW